MSKKLSPKRIVERAIYLQRELEAVKPYYAELDKLTEWIVANRVNLSKYPIEVVDNFAEKNTAWRSTPMRRFELKRVVK